MKIKQRLHCFSALEEDVEDEQSQSDANPKHVPMTYEGIYDAESIQGDRYCLDRPS